MQRLIFHQDLPAPVDRSFEHLAEHENLGPLFGVRVERVRDGEDGTRNGVGSTRRLSFAGLLPFEETTTEVEPGRRIAYRITKGTPLNFHRGEMLFSPTPDGRGTHLHYEIVFSSRLPGVEQLVALGLGLNVRRGLARLRP